jgi:hypothetical protein
MKILFILSLLFLNALSRLSTAVSTRTQKNYTEWIGTPDHGSQLHCAANTCNQDLILEAELTNTTRLSIPALLSQR